MAPRISEIIDNTRESLCVFVVIRCSFEGFVATTGRVDGLVDGGHEQGVNRLAVGVAIVAAVAVERHKCVVGSGHFDDDAVVGRAGGCQ